MSISLTVEDFVRERLDDVVNKDYYNDIARELEAICWRFVSSCRCSTLSLDMCSLGTRMTPLPTPGDSSAGPFWAYCYSQYNPSLYNHILAQCSIDQMIDQPNHKYALFNCNAYINGVYAVPQPHIDEIALLAEFSTTVVGPVTLAGYPINISRLMGDIFDALANSLGKLSISQSSVGGTTDLRSAALEANRQAGVWRRGSMIYKAPNKGVRRGYYHG